MSDVPHLSPKQRRQRNREEMTAAIVQVSRDIMREQGVANLNLNEIARRLKMRTPSLYEYFPSKLALYDHLFLTGTRLFRARMAQVTADPARAPWEHLEQTILAYLQFAIDNPDLFRLLFERHVPAFVPSDESMAEMYAALADSDRNLQAFLEATQLAPAAEPDQMRDYVIALMHGITALHLANSPDQPIGTGRFGSLIPLVMEMLKRSWGNREE